MAEEKREKWLGWLALTTVVFAVGAALSTFKGGSYSTRAMLSQNQASDQWSFYQAKSIKGYLYEVQKEKLDLERRLYAASAPPELIAEYGRRIAAYEEKIRRYEGEKDKIMADARALEKTRDEAKAHQSAFGQAVVLLQVTILLSSVAALLKKRVVWHLALAVGAVGLVWFANGFLLFM